MDNEQILYDKKADILTIKVDELPDDMMDVSTAQPIELILDMVFNKNTGGLLEFSITGLRSAFEDDPPDSIEYDPESDTLLMHLDHRDERHGLCDMVYHDPRNHVLVSLNRSKVGNLLGIEICGLETLIENTINIRENTVS